MLDRIPLGAPGQEAEIGVRADSDADKDYLKRIIALARNTRVNGRLTQGALILRRLERSGFARGVVFVAHAEDFARDGRRHFTGANTSAAGSDGNISEEAIARAQRGLPAAARIHLEIVDAIDAVPSFEHELVHAVKILTGAGHYQNIESEDEGVRVENEALVAIGLSEHTTDTYQTIHHVDGWNRYIPWITEAGTHR